MTLMDGKSLRDELLQKYKEKIEKESLDIRLDIITVGEDAASEVYVRNKVKYATEVGIEVVTHKLANSVGEKDIIELIDELNSNDEVTGIILQSPIPDGLDFKKCAGRIDHHKDIDGFTLHNIGNLYLGNVSLVPCTVKGIMVLLEHYKIDLKGKNVTVVGRSEIVGKPLTLALINRDATVTVCHSKTRDLIEHTKNADIVISAVGKKGVITEEMVADGFVGIDVGINRIDGKLYGDFDYEGVASKASFITPVPGGVGPMTVAMIIDNLIIAKTMKR